jgi:hypothetical protein
MYITELIITHKNCMEKLVNFLLQSWRQCCRYGSYCNSARTWHSPVGGQRWKVPRCSMQALTKNPAKAAMEGPHKHFFTSVNTDFSLFAASTSSGDATATTTPLSLTVSTTSANSLKSLRLSCGSQHCQCDLC